MAEKKTNKVKYSEPTGYFPKELLAKFDEKPKKKSSKKKVSKKK